MSSITFSKQHFLIFWLINPFLSGWFLLKRIRLIPQIAPYLLLSFFFGISFVISPDSLADSTRYASELQSLHISKVGFSDYISSLYSVESTKLDIYQPIITWLVSQVTDNYQWLFGIYALVFGYFWFKSLILIRDLMPQRLGFIMILLLVLLALINPIWSINGVRMWTAVQVFFYGLLLLNLKKDNIGYIFLIASIFIHFSLTIPLVLYGLFKILPTKNHSILYGAYVVTFFVGEMNLEAISQYFEQLPTFLQSRKGYLNDELIALQLEGVSQNASHIQLYRNLLKYLIVFLASWVFFKYFFKQKSGPSSFTNFFALALFFSAFNNIASQIPSGGRFIVLSDLLIVASFIWYLSQNIGNKIPGFVHNIMLVPMLFIILVQVRIGLDHIGLFFFIGNPIVNLFIQDKVPLIDFIKSIFE